MRAAVYDTYGGPEQLRIEELAHPEPGAGRVLVRVMAVGLNGSDTEFLTGRPAYARVNGLRRPRNRVLGSDIAGTVVAVGTDVAGLSVGDAVFGDIFDQRGGLAEFVVAPAKLLIKRPDGLDAVTAAALPQNGAIAAQGLGAVEPGQKILVNGAGGAAGAWAVAMAAAKGAEVWAVDTAAKGPGLETLGAARVLDYRTTDFARLDQRFDIILDLFGTRGPLAIRHVLARRGRYCIVGGQLGPMLRCAFLGPMIGALSGRSMGPLMLKQSVEQQKALAAMAPGPVIDSVHDFDDVQGAFARALSGEAVGKVIVRFPDGV